MPFEGRCHSLGGPLLPVHRIGKEGVGKEKRAEEGEKEMLKIEL